MANSNIEQSEKAPSKEFIQTSLEIGQFACDLLVQIDPATLGSQRTDDGREVRIKSESLPGELTFAFPRNPSKYFLEGFSRIQRFAKETLSPMIERYPNYSPPRSITVGGLSLESSSLLKEFEKDLRGLSVIEDLNESLNNNDRLLADIGVQRTQGSNAATTIYRKGTLARSEQNLDRLVKSRI